MCIEHGEGCAIDILLIESKQLKVNKKVVVGKLMNATICQSILSPYFLIPRLLAKYIFICYKLFGVLKSALIKKLMFID